MLDQFKPWYFGVAFAFVFKYCTGMPDMPAFMKQPRYRRDEDAPYVEAPLWVRIMSRRVEAQVARDWSFGFVSWNYVFRSAVNLSRTWYAYTTVSPTGARELMTAEEIGKGAVEVTKALWGKYKDVDDRQKSVAGDMTKLRYVPGLSAPAKRLIANMESTAKRLPGTQEARRVMRFETNALRVKYGVPLFITFSPDESHNLLMIRLSRTRRNDPAVKSGNSTDKQCASRIEPQWCPQSGDCTMSLPTDAILNQIPTWSERRRLLARDPLASVDGFRTMVYVVYKYIFGMRVCPNCPRFNV